MTTVPGVDMKGRLCDKLQVVCSILTKAGVDPTISWNKKGNIFLTNLVSIFLSFCGLVLFAIIYLNLGFIFAAKLALVNVGLLLLSIVFNRLRYINLSRFWLISLITLVILFTSVIGKVRIHNNMETIGYVTFRIVLLASSIFPLLLFRLKEYPKIIAGMCFNFFALFLYDPIHHLFGVGYYDLGLTDPNYYFLNYIFVFSFVILNGGVLFLKVNLERYAMDKEKLSEELSYSFQDLQQKNISIGYQQQEIKRANEIIQKQHKALQEINEGLTKELFEKNEQLNKSNLELVRHNNELLQFSYTISHNLKGPVSSLLGLINLLDKEKFDPAVTPLMTHVRKTVQSLETVITDLNHIIDIRFSSAQLKQMIFIEDEIMNIKNLLQQQIDQLNAKIIIQTENASKILSIKSMINSILYNLINNSLKYHSPDRAPIILIKSSIIKGFLRIDVQDNGMGMDMDKYKEKMFGLFKRFHTHTEGKGLGLFLAKLQTEMLDGKIEVESKEGVGTTFSVFFPIGEDEDDQIFFNNDYVKITYNARLNCMTSKWKKSVPLDEFSQLFIHIVEFMKSFRLPNWIADISETYNDEESFNKVRLNYTLKMQSYGLKRMGFVLPKEDYSDEEYRNKIESIRKVYSFETYFANTTNEIEDWLKMRNFFDRESLTT